MKFDLTKSDDMLEAKNYLAQRILAGSVVEISLVSPKRSLNQNSYLHLLLADFGSHFGYTLEESKQIYKELSKDLYFYEKENRGKKRQFVRSSADLTKEEMSKSVERFMKVSAEAGYPLPPATDEAWLIRSENFAEQNKRYL